MPTPSDRTPDRPARRRQPALVGLGLLTAAVVLVLILWAVTRGGGPSKDAGAATTVVADIGVDVVGESADDRRPGRRVGRRR